MPADELIADWLRRAAESQYAHYECAKHFARQNYYKWAEARSVIRFTGSALRYELEGIDRWLSMGAAPLRVGSTGRRMKRAYLRTEEIRMKYMVRLLHSDESVSVSVPGLPGCWSQSVTEEEALDNIKSAIQEYLATVSDELENAEVREIEVVV